MNEITVKQAGDLTGFNTFLAEIEPDIEKAKGLVVLGDEGVAHATKLSGKLKDYESNLKSFELKLIELGGIKVVGDEKQKITDIRLTVDRQVRQEKENVKTEAVQRFVSEVAKIVESSTASDVYKKTINAHMIALEQIKGKASTAKSMESVLRIEKDIIADGLSENAKETAEKHKIIALYEQSITTDIVDFLMGIPLEAVKPELENRKLKRDAEIKEAAKKLAKPVELKKVEAGSVEFKVKVEGEITFVATEAEAKLIATEMNEGRVVITNEKYRVVLSKVTSLKKS